MNFFSDGLDQLVPYVPGEQPKMKELVKLNTNENPFPPSPQVLSAIVQAAQHNLELYPDPQALQLRETIAQYYAKTGLRKEQVFVGNGSDEVLAHAFRAFFVQTGRTLLRPDISYSFYQVYAQLFGIQTQSVPLQSNWGIGSHDFIETLPAAQCSGLVFANPNAPTGIALPLHEIERLLQHFDQQVVLIDEAYVDFGAESAVNLVQRYANLLVVQTLSKSRSLAGLRVGVAIGQSALIHALDSVKDSFNSYPLGRLAQAGAIAAYRDDEYFEKTRQIIIANRQWLLEALRQRDFLVLPSSANFLFAKHKLVSAAILLQKLREQAVLVRHISGNSRIIDFLRITVGSQEQCQLFLNALDKVLA